jgi:hypothetical protein
MTFDQQQLNNKTIKPTPVKQLTSSPSPDVLKANFSYEVYKRKLKEVLN